MYNNIDVVSNTVSRLCYPSWWLNGSCIDKTVHFNQPYTFSHKSLNTDSWRVEPEVEDSFSKVKAQRLIKMTPLSVGSVREKNFVLRVPHVKWDAHYIYVRQAYYGWTFKSDIGIARAEYFQNYSYPGMRSVKSAVPFYGISDDQITSEVPLMLNSVSGDCITRLGSDLDALTNAAEFPEAYKMIISLLKAALNPLRGIKELVKRYKRARRKGMTHLEIMSDLSSDWLQYRYGIMPLVYSIQDVVALLDTKGDEFKTGRSREHQTLSLSRKADAQDDSEAFYQEVRGTIDVSAVGKAKYGSENLRLADQIDFNLFATAWELIPFSFVIDWFINVGEVLYAHTSMLGALAVQTKFCRSVRKKYTVTTRYKHQFVDTFEETFGPFGYNQGGVFHQTHPAEHISLSRPYDFDEVCQKVDYNTYDRTLFSPSDVGFSLNVSLSWMRQLDALALILSNLISKLR